jgi:hypothetical protein
VLIYLLDLSAPDVIQIKDRPIKVIQRRYDIVDFGPAVSLDKQAGMFGQAYEIKSSSDKEYAKGREYILRQTDKFNADLKDFLQTIKGAFDIDHLIGYRVRPGTQWPPNANGYLLPIGPNILYFYRESPGVIIYKWVKFEPKLLQQIWNYYRETFKNVKDSFSTRPEWSQDAVLLASFIGATAIIAIVAGIVFAAPALAAATTAVEIQAGLVAATLLASLRAWATPPGAGSLARSGGNRGNVRNVNKAVDVLRGTVSRSSWHLGRPAMDGVPAENLPGGTEKTKDERNMSLLIQGMVDATLFVHSIEVGQGRLSQDDLAVLSANLNVSLESLFQSVEPAFLLSLVGEEAFDERSALKIGHFLVAVGRGALRDTPFGQFWFSLSKLSDQDLDDSLPVNCDADGEVIE